jgi:hypothetical protein
MIEDPDWIHWVTSWLHGANDESGALQRGLAEAVRQADAADLQELSEAILQEPDLITKHPSRMRAVLQCMAARVLAARASNSEAFAEDFGFVSEEILRQLYQLTNQVDAIGSSHALQCLAAQGDDGSLATLAEILHSDPPGTWQAVGISLSPLWSQDSSRLGYFFACMENADMQVSVLPVVLDLANHSVRCRKLNSHPFASNEPGLRRLLADVVVRLEKMEKDPGRFGNEVEQVQRVIGEGVSLTISLCDALGWIGQPDSISVLVDAMELSHRRLQVEAAAALVRLGDPRGKQRMLALAADPAARRRVVQYAEELEFAGEIDEQYRTAESLAESELVAWLASPEQFGLPPKQTICVDRRTLYWPGYEEPRDCYLFQYHYQFPDGDFTNFGIAGPLTHTFSVSLNGLDLEDVYAAFAGWHAEHEEIYEVPMQRLNELQRRESERLETAFQREGFQMETPIALTYLLGEPALLAHINREGQALVGITDGNEVTCYAQDEARVAGSPELVLAIFRGRKLLRAFNG